MDYVIVEFFVTSWLVGREFGNHRRRLGLWNFHSEPKESIIKVVKVYYLVISLVEWFNVN